MPKFLDSPQDNIVTELIEPHLGSCIKYRRLAAFFRPSVLKVWKNVLEHVVNNDVKIQIIIGGTSTDNVKLLSELNQLNSDEEKNALLDRRAEEILDEAAQLNSSISVDNQRNILAWLIKEGKLEFKLSFVVHQTDYELDHRKTGYFEKDSGQKIVFSGSVNESDSAYVRHGEELTIWDSEDPADDIYVNRYTSKLDNLWQEEPSEIWKVRKPDEKFFKKVSAVCTIRNKNQANNELKKLLKEYENEEELDSDDKALDSKTVHKLRPYQDDAIKIWEKDNSRGILEHATGSGKTFTALNALKNTFHKTGCMAIVGVPYIPLAEQWSDEINLFFKNSEVESFNIVECWSGNRNWHVKVQEELIDRAAKKRAREKHLSIFVVVNKSLEQKFYKSYKDPYFEAENCLMIGDECHRYTSLNLLYKLPDCKYRLGLSATPIVDKENIRENENEMLEWFGGIRHEFSLEDAIGSEPKYLCDYNYFPQACYLTDDEFSEWDKLYKKSGWMGDENEYDNNIKGSIFGQMSSILGSAESKFNKLIEILPTGQRERENTLIFSGHGVDENEQKDIKKIAKILMEKNWTASQITSEVKRQERRNIIDAFKKSAIDALLAIRILDEGIDIPQIKNAYIIASSANRRQFIQRRGRVLRLLDGEKKIANIYDFVVIPPKASGRGGAKIRENEKKRIEEMSRSALNQTDVIEFIKKYL